MAGALGGVMISEILPSGKMLAIRIGTVLAINISIRIVSVVSVITMNTS